MADVEKGQQLTVISAQASIPGSASGNVGAEPLNEKSSTVENASTENFVTWDGDDDPQNPLNWSLKWKWTITILSSLAEFVTMMSGSMVAPALPELSKEFGFSAASVAIVLSIILLAFAAGPMVLGPISEMYGRRPVFLVCGVWYSLWNVICGLAHNRATLIAARFLSGFGAAIVFVVAFPILWDLWHPHQRGLSFAISGIAPVIGPAIGPVFGAALVQTVGWRYIFYVAAAANGVLIILAFFLFPETSAARILHLKAEDIRKRTSQSCYTEWEASDVTLQQRIWLSLSRPFRLLFFHPILLLVSVFTAYSFGLLYIVLSTYSALYTDLYGESTLDSGLHYLALAVGYTFAEQVGGVLMDKFYDHLVEKNKDQEPTPEYRVPLMIPGGVMIPVGLLWYGWSAHAKMFWIMPDIGAAIFAAGFMMNTNALQSYILDSFTKYTASAGAAAQVLRMITAFVFPIFAPAMYHRLGYGVANTILAAIAVVMGLVAPAVLWKFGPRIRAIGTHPL